MAPPTAKDLLVDYASDSDAASDSDFAPDAAGPDPDVDADGSDSSSSSSSGDEVADRLLPVRSGRKRKRKHTGGALHQESGSKTQTPVDGEAEDVGFENSGDEAIISKGRKKRRKKDVDGERDADEDGGDGGWVKTRRMRAVEKEEKRYKLDKEPVTVDVDALWTQMISGAEPPSPSLELTPDVPQTQASRPSGSGQDMVLIKRSFTFAGKLHTEEKLVPRSSAEARLYLASQAQSRSQQGQTTNGPATATNTDERPPPRRAFRSAFEPVLETGVNVHRPDLDLSMRTRNEKERARKLNTVEKSRMDWAGYVDKEGIKDELDLAGRAKGSFAGRQEFLARSEMRREEDARRARVAARA